MATEKQFRRRCQDLERFERLRAKRVQRTSRQTQWVEARLGRTSQARIRNIPGARRLAKGRGGPLRGCVQARRT